MRKHKGKVFLVGAGPGDPGLLTLKARDALRAADVVLYDYLIHPGVLKFSRRGARLIYVGKHPLGRGARPFTQRQVESLMIRHARKGRLVARLKGGDPFVFGRGGEECETLRRAKVACEIIPGVSSAIAAPAAAGIPVTHRKCSSSVTIVTGHEQTAQSRVNWERVARGAQTLVILMGVTNLSKIVAKLLRGGLPRSTPIVAIRWGTWEKQESHAATLGTASRRLKGLRRPAVLVVGRVARYHRRPAVLAANKAARRHRRPARGS